MSTSGNTFGPARAIATIAFGIGLLLLGFAFYEWLQIQRLKTQLLVAESSHSADQRKLQALETNTQVLGKQVSTLQQDSDELAAGIGGAGGGGGAPPVSPGSLDPKVAGQRFLAAYPQARELLNTVGKAQFAMQYAPFFKAAGLTAGQIEQLEDVTMDAWSRSLAVESRGGIHPTVTQAPDDQLRAVLGDQVFQQYQAYSHTLPEQNVALQIATEAGLAGTPISPDQAAQLAQTIGSTGVQNQSGSVPLNSVNWETAANGAQNVLSPEQYRAAQSVFAQMQYQQALQEAQRSQNVTIGNGPGR